MSKVHRNQFFEQVRDPSRVKLRIYEKYLVPWAAKVGSPQHVPTIWVVDGFAGPGSYKDSGETPGSPRLILERARAAIESSAPYRIRCIFVENDPGNWRSLKALCDQYDDVDPQPLRGDFWDKISEIENIVSGQPLLMFTDPFGVKGMDYKKLARIAIASPKCDVIVTFMTSAVGRLLSQYSDDVVTAIGPSRNTDLSPAETFGRNLSDSGNFLAGGRFPLRQSADSTEKYELIFFSRSPHAYHIWNDLVTREWQQLRQARAMAQAAKGQRHLFPMEEIDAAEDLRSAANSVLDWLRQSNRDTFQRKEMIDDFVVSRFSDYHSSTLRQAVMALESTKRITCEVKRAADTSDWRVIDWTEL